MDPNQRQRRRLVIRAPTRLLWVQKCAPEKTETKLDQPEDCRKQLEIFLVNAGDAQPLRTRKWLNFTVSKPPIYTTHCRRKPRLSGSKPVRSCAGKWRVAAVPFGAYSS